MISILQTTPNTTRTSSATGIYSKNISQIVDDIFNDYVVRQGSVEPLFTQYCNGTTSTCDGLSQWGTVDLADQGLIPYEILQYYFGDDINIVFGAPVQGIERSYPGVPLRQGQCRRGCADPPAAAQPDIRQLSGNPQAAGGRFFGVETEAAVRGIPAHFQPDSRRDRGKSNLVQDQKTYNGVKGLSELYPRASPSMRPSGSSPGSFSWGTPATLYGSPNIIWPSSLILTTRFPKFSSTAISMKNTLNGVQAFQREYGLDPTGVIDRETWNRMMQVYADTIASVPPETLEGSEEIYPGRFSHWGMQGDDVRQLQIFPAGGCRPPAIASFRPWRPPAPSIRPLRMR